MTSRTSRAATVLLVLTAVLATACSSPDPQTRLEDAFGRTLEDPFVYELTVEADQEALEGLGPQGAQVGPVLQGLAVAGQRGDGAFELRLGFGGFDLLQLRSLRDDELYLRMALDQLGAFLGGQGFEPDETVVPPLEQAGVSQDVIEAVRAAFNGRWVGIQGEIDSDALQDALGGTATPAEPTVEDEDAVRDALCDDPEGFAECYIEVQGSTEEDGRTVYQVQLALRELARALAEAAPTGGEQVRDLEADLADLPAQVPATVTVVDDVVTRVAVDVAEVMRASGSQVQGSIEVRVDLSDHGAVDPVTPPDDAVTISGDELADAMAAMTELMRIAGDFQEPGAPTPPPTTPTPPPTIPSPTPTSG